jgi:hypothetical protein
MPSDDSSATSQMPAEFVVVHSPELYGLGHRQRGGVVHRDGAVRGDNDEAVVRKSRSRAAATAASSFVSSESIRSIMKFASSNHEAPTLPWRANVARMAAVSIDPRMALSWFRINLSRARRNGDRKGHRPRRRSITALATNA